MNFEKKRFSCLVHFGPIKKLHILLDLSKVTKKCEFILGGGGSVFKSYKSCT